MMLESWDLARLMEKRMVGGSLVVIANIFTNDERCLSLKSNHLTV